MADFRKLFQQKADEKQRQKAVEEHRRQVEASQEAKAIEDQRARLLAAAPGLDASVKKMLGDWVRVHKFGAWTRKVRFEATGPSFDDKHLAMEWRLKPRDTPPGYRLKDTVAVTLHFTKDDQGLHPERFWLSGLNGPHEADPTINDLASILADSAPYSFDSYFASTYTYDP